MTINISLSTQSIQAAIRKLTARQDALDDDLEELVDILTEEGANIAQSSYGDFPVQAVAVGTTQQGEHGFSNAINVSGDMPLIAEFGAGDATLDPSGLFENSPNTDVFPGSYSIEEGTMEYYMYGQWHFGGQAYREVLPRMGLYNAKQHIISTGTQTAMEVMHYD